MVREAAVQSALGLGPDEQLQERGVYRPSLDGELAQPPSGPERSATLGPGETILGPEWLDDEQLEHQFSADPVLAAAFPSGARVTRADIEPRILLLENIPTPTNSVGHVRLLGKNRWVLDSRGDVAALQLPYPEDDHDLVVWGERGEVRLFTVRHAS